MVTSTGDATGRHAGCDPTGRPDCDPPVTWLTRPAAGTAAAGGRQTARSKTGRRGIGRREDGDGEKRRQKMSRDGETLRHDGRHVYSNIIKDPGRTFEGSRQGKCFLIHILSRLS